MSEDDDTCYAEFEQFCWMNLWTPEDVKFWTQTPLGYCPWKDVAAFFRDHGPDTWTHP